MKKMTKNPIINSNNTTDDSLVYTISIGSITGFLVSKYIM